METNRPAHPDRIALISPPWPLYTRPSIQIGALKAFVRSRFPAVEVSAHHVYLRVAEAIGYKQYHAISERTWLAESVFAALLYPDRAETIARLFRREASGNPELRGMDFARLAARVEAVTEDGSPPRTGTNSACSVSPACSASSRPASTSSASSSSATRGSPWPWGDPRSAPSRPRRP